MDTNHDIFNQTNIKGIQSTDECPIHIQVHRPQIGL